MRRTASNTWRASSAVLIVWLTTYGRLCTGGLAADWPQWRGPARDGQSAERGLLGQWPQGGPPLVWKATGLGRGYSSVAVVGNRIYTAGLVAGGQAVLTALDLHGHIVWQTPIAEREEPPNSTPTVDGDRLYVITHRGQLVCCSTMHGQILWQKNFRRDFDGQMMSGWGYSESPLVDGDLLVCTPGGKQALLAALDKKTGAVVWNCAVTGDLGPNGADGAAYSSIVLSHAAGVKQYVQLVGRGLVGVEAATGKLLWHYNRIANGTANIPTPVVRDDYVFGSCGYDSGAVLLRIQRNNDGSLRAQEVYYLPGRQLQNHHGGMILLGDYLYLGHGHNNGFPLCIEWLTGKEMWRPGRGPGSGSAAIAYADGHLYFRYQDGTMALIEATPTEYRLKGSFPLPSRLGESWPHPVIANGHLYLRDQDVLLCYDIRRPSGS
ncbi:MAG: polyvinyl alcohol dehydrogenase [Pirellulaceae bacterium]|nr:MAG: polyvinyl alcohol dehydrogenase [Pirellulaceae bacterium]